MGGDCLNTGCVPSKALIAAAREAARLGGAGVFDRKPHFGDFFHRPDERWNAIPSGQACPAGRRPRGASAGGGGGF